MLISIARLDFCNLFEHIKSLEKILCRTMGCHVVEGICRYLGFAVRKMPPLMKSSLLPLFAALLMGVELSDQDKAAVLIV